MNIIKRKNTKIIDDACGKIQELFHADNLSIAYITVTGKATPHLHKHTEEVYFVVKGKGIITIDSEQKKVEKDDVIPIPQNKFHSIQNIADESLELLVVTHPRYDPEDVIEKI